MPRLVPGNLLEVLEYQGKGELKDGRTVWRFADTQYGDTETHLSMTRNSVTVTSKEEVNGTHPSGKSWKRWRVHRQDTFIDRGNKSRIITSRKMRRPGLKTYDNTINMIHDRDMLSLMERGIARHFGWEKWDAKELRRIIAPQLIEGPQSWQANPGVMMGLRQSTPRGMVEQLFGKTRYRKDLLKAVGNLKYLEPLALGVHMRGLVPIDWIVDSLKQYHVFEIPTLDSQRGRMEFVRYSRRGLAERPHREIFRHLDQRTLKKLLMEVDPNYWDLQDSSRLWIDLKAKGALPDEMPKLGGWRELHDFLSDAHHRLAIADEAIKQDKFDAELDGLTGQGVEIRTAKSTHELMDWGRDMSNCIGTYGRVALAKSTYLAGIYAGGSLIGNMEVSRSRRAIVQLVGRFNQPLPPAQRDEVVRITGFELASYAGGWGNL